MVQRRARAERSRSRTTARSIRAIGSHNGMPGARTGDRQPHRQLGLGIEGRACAEHGPFDGVGLPVDGFELGDHEVEHGRHLGPAHHLGPVLVDRLGGVADDPAEESGRFVEALHPLLDERRQCREEVGIEVAQERQRPGDELVERERPDVLGVEVLELLDVEEGGRLVDVGQLELGDELLDRGDLDVVLGTPTEREQVVPHRLGEEAPLPVVADGDVVSALRQFLPLLVDDEGEVGIPGLVARPEGLSEQEHAGRGVDEVLTPDHVGDPHVEVVDGVGDVEHRHPARADDDEVLEHGAVELDPAPDEVVPTDRALVGCPEANHHALAGGDVAIPTEPVVAGTARRFGPLLDRLLGTVASVGQSTFDEVVGRSPVPIEPIGLVVFLVPVDPQPSEAVVNRRHQLRAAPIGIGVFDAQHHHPSGVPSVEPVEQRRTGTADVQVAGGSGRETNTNGHRAEGSERP